MEDAGDQGALVVVLKVVLEDMLNVLRGRDEEEVGDVESLAVLAVAAKEVLIQGPRVVLKHVNPQLQDIQLVHWSRETSINTITRSVSLNGQGCGENWISPHLLPH